jgi:DNA-binding response OmpR family regulator
VLYVENRTPSKYEEFLQRVLVLDAQPAATRLMAELLKEMRAGMIRCENNVKSAINAARDDNPQIIFTEYAGPHWDGLQFVRTLRRSDLACRKAPVIMVTGEATAQAILGARDAGVHEFLRKPYTIKDLVRRIDAVTVRSRDWIEAVGYVGPDRRRFNSGEYMGPRKRKSDVSTPDVARLDQAMRIVRSALSALEADPKQALRSLQAQAADLTKLAVSMHDTKLATAAAVLQRQVMACETEGRVSRVNLQAAAQPLFALMPQNWAAA